MMDGEPALIEGVPLRRAAQDGPLTTKLALLAAIAVIDSAAVPVLRRVTVWAALLPTATEPKASAAGDALAIGPAVTFGLPRYAAMSATSTAVSTLLR